MKKKIIALFSLGVLSSTGAWAQEQTDKTQHQTFRIDKVQRQQRSQFSEKKSFRASYTPLPDPIPLNKHFRIKLQVQDAQNKILNNAKLKLDAGMPEHNHGMNVKPKVNDLGQGIFEVRGLLFHMPGYWEIYVDIEAEGKTERVIFGITVDMKAMPNHSQEHKHHH